MARGKNPNLIYIPRIRHYTVKNPKTLWPIDWEEKLGPERVSYDEEPIFDKDGNYIETKRNVYVVMEELIGFTIMKRNKNKNSKIKEKRLFETYSTMKKDEEK